MGEPDENEIETIDSLSPRLGEAISVNSGEWLLADAELIVNDKKIPARDLILGPWHLQDPFSSGVPSQAET
jgi:hypothetical protein